MAQKTIELIARGALIHNGRLLLCRNRKHGHAFLPGGHVEFAEPAREALAREIREELGMELVPRRFLGTMEACFRQSKAGQESAGRRHHEVNLVFELLTTPGDELDPAALQSREKHIEFIWVSLEDLLADPPALTVLPPGILKLIVADQTWHSEWK